MPVSSRPKPRSKDVPNPKVDVEALIARGGSVAGQPPSPPRVPGRGVARSEERRSRVGESDDDQEPTTMNVQLRLVPALVERIDRVRRGRAVRVPRHTWLLEAVAEKLAREEQR